MSRQILLPATPLSLGLMGLVFLMDRNSQLWLCVSHFDREDFPAIAVGVGDPDLVLRRKATINIHLIRGCYAGVPKLFLHGEDRSGGVDLYAQMVQRALIGDVVAIV